MIEGKKIKFFFIIICTLQFLYIFHFRSDFNYKIIKNPFGKDSGITHSVSAEIIELSNIIKENDIYDFNLSKKLRQNTYFYQRSVEFNYPKRINKNSKFKVFELEEEILNNCQLIDEGKYIKLTQC